MFVINGKKWRVKFVSPFHSALQKDSGETALGMCYRDDQTIYINDIVEGKMFKKVLCHEIVHAAMYSYDVYLDEREEELIADAIATYGEEIIRITNNLFYQIQTKGNY